MTSFDLIHDNLLDASREIGGVHETSEWASTEVAELIAATGIPVDDLAVGELRKIIREHSERLRQQYREENERAARARVEARS